MNTCYLYNVFTWPHWNYDGRFLSPSKINGMTHRIIIYESTPKKLNPSQNSTHAAQCSSTAPADWEEVLSSITVFSFSFTHPRNALNHLSLQSMTLGSKMDFQCAIITVNNLKQRHHRDAPELHILPFCGFSNFLSKSDLEHMLQLKRTLTTAKA